MIVSGLNSCDVERPGVLRMHGDCSEQQDHQQGQHVDEAA